MKYVNFGKTGLKVSRICLGCMSYAVDKAGWRLSEVESRPFIQRALYTATEDSDRKVVDVVSGLATRRGISNAQVALAWLLSKPVVTAPIVGATKPPHLEDAVAALEVTLSAEEIAQLEAPYAPHPVAGIV